jgi:hypothetical protein
VTASELIATLSRLPADAPVILDVSIGTFLDVEARTDDEGVRLVPAGDKEGTEFVSAVRTLFLEQGS